MGLLLLLRPGVPVHSDEERSTDLVLHNLLNRLPCREGECPLPQVEDPDIPINGSSIKLYLSM